MKVYDNNLSPHSHEIPSGVCVPSTGYTFTTLDSKSFENHIKKNSKTITNLFKDRIKKTYFKCKWAPEDPGEVKRIPEQIKQIDYTVKKY